MVRFRVRVLVVVVRVCRWRCVYRYVSYAMSIMQHACSLLWLEQVWVILTVGIGLVTVSLRLTLPTTVTNSTVHQAMPILSVLVEYSFISTISMHSQLTLLFMPRGLSRMIHIKLCRLGLSILVFKFICFVIVITFYSGSCLGKEKAKGPFGLWVKLPHVYHAGRRFHTVPLIAKRQAGKLWIPIFIVFGMSQSRIEPKFTASVADALSTWLFIGVLDLSIIQRTVMIIILLLLHHHIISISVYYHNSFDWTVDLVTVRC